MNREHRSIKPSEVRVTADDGKHTFEAVVMNYGVKDTYSTVFDAGCFTESLKARLPRITWGHDWHDPIGRYVDYVDTDKSLTLVGELDDFDAVPRARQAYAQLNSGTIDQFSVGFGRDQISEDDDGTVHFVRATLDEAALVLVGAVPNTKLVSVRSAQSGLSLVRQVPEDLVITLGKKIANKEITHEEAEAALWLASGEGPPEKPPEEVPEAPDLADVLAEADELLDA